MWPNLAEILESDSSIKVKLSYLNSVISVCGLKLDIESEIQFVKKKIKQLCLITSRRMEGLLLLYAVVHSNSSLYIEDWYQIILGSLKCPDYIISKDIPLKVLNKMLINFGSDFNYSDDFSKVVPDVLSILLEPQDEEFNKLYCQSLAVCMKYAPEIAGTRKDDIEKFLLKELDNPYAEIIEAVGECFAALPQCILHFKKTGSLKYKDVWCDIFTKIMNTMHSLLNSLLKLSEGQAEYFDVSKVEVFDISSSASDDIPISQIDVFKSLCQCMAKMMSSENRFVRLPVAELLETLFRVFQVQKIIKHPDQDARTGYFKLAFPQMLNGVHVIFEALILNFRIIDQSYNFMVLVKLCLHAMEDTFSQSSVSQVRGSTWKLVNVWLKQFGSKGSYQLANEKSILQGILIDIDIEEKQLKSSDIEEEKNQKANVNKTFACTYALKALKSLLETSSCYMEKNSLDKMCSTLLRISKIVLRQISPKKHFPFPYSDEECRKMLLDVLHTCAVYSDPLHSKCIIEAQNIFNAASRDTSAKVRRICHRFRKLSRYYLNPRKPPPDAMQYSNPSMLNIQKPILEGLRNEWTNGIELIEGNGPSRNDHKDDSKVAHVQGENAHSDRVESELMPIEQETESHMNHDYRRVTKQSSQSLGEESIDDSDIEPTYISTDSNPQRIGINDSPRINSFSMQACVEQFANGLRTDRLISEGVVPNLANSVENDTEEHNSFVEVKAAQKPPQVPVENGDWKKGNNSESEEDESDMDEEGDEEGEVNEEVSAGDEISDGKHSPEFDEERPRKRQKCMEEEGYEEEYIEDEDIPMNNQSSEEEENEGNSVPALEENPGSISETIIDDEDDETQSGSPSIREMCEDFVLAEPAASEIS